MSQSTRNEYLEKMRYRYGRRRTKTAKSRLISEFCEVTGYERKYAIKLLKGQRGANSNRAKKGKKRGVSPTYGEAEMEVLYDIWRHAEQPCGKRLKPSVKLWLPAYEARHGELEEQVRDKVQKISPAQIDRLLSERKISHGRRKIRTPKANAAIKAKVPIRAESWDAREPGWVEADTVAHCGGDMGESFIWSLTATDIHSGWTEVRPTWNRGQYGVCAAFEAMETVLPFVILGLDTDNGGEFLNYHLYTKLTSRKPAVEMTRSRPYRKNDQAHVEQKNDTHVRQLLGYDRLGYMELLEPLNELLEAWSVWRNCYSPSFKQCEKRREGNKIIRRHEKEPKTPCDRLVEYLGVEGADDTARKILDWRNQLDPFELKEWIEKKLSQIWELDRELNQAKSEGKRDLEGVARPILEANLRSAPIGLQNRTFEPYRAVKTKKQTKNESTSEPKSEKRAEA